MNTTNYSFSIQTMQVKMYNFWYNGKFFRFLYPTLLICLPCITYINAQGYENNKTYTNNIQYSLLLHYSHNHGIQNPRCPI